MESEGREGGREEGRKKRERRREGERERERSGREAVCVRHEKNKTQDTG